MKLDRNTTGNGKYWLVKTRPIWKLPEGLKAEVLAALDCLRVNGVLDEGRTPETEFFVIRLKDRFAGRALDSYADAASQYDPEYGDEVKLLADRAGPHSPFCKYPD